MDERAIWYLVFLGVVFLGAAYAAGGSSEIIFTPAWLGDKAVGVFLGLLIMAILGGIFAEVKKQARRAIRRNGGLWKPGPNARWQKRTEPAAPRLSWQERMILGLLIQQNQRYPDANTNRRPVAPEADDRTIEIEF